MAKEIRISMRIDSELKTAFFELCERRQQVPSKVIKYFMQQYVNKAEKEKED